MNELSDSHSTPNPLSRRSALGRAMIAGIGLAGFRLPAAEPMPEVPPRAAEFVPENDYPYFGYEPHAE